MYRVTAGTMCRCLQVPRSTYYYEAKERDHQDEKLTKQIIKIFKDSRRIYGQRKIKKELKKLGFIVSRRRIGRIMKEHGLVSKYTIAHYKPMKPNVNEEKIGNTLNREFDEKDELEVIVSDLTYVRVGQRWHYICILIDLFNREIIGYSAGPHKTAELVTQAFASVKYNLYRLKIFHTDRGSEFKNKSIDKALKAFDIERSLSTKGTPYDNAVAEATFKILKTEFINGEYFETQADLDLGLFDYVNWYNNVRIHGSLGYLTPKAYKEQIKAILPAS